MSERIYNLKSLAKLTYEVGVKNLDLELLLNDMNKTLSVMGKDPPSPMLIYSHDVLENMIESKKLEIKRCAIEIEYLKSKL